MLSRGNLKALWIAVVALMLTWTVQSSAQGLTRVSVRLKWLPQAQFAGYYVAKEKGFYAEEGLDVTINPGGPNLVAENLVAGGADQFGHAGGAESLLPARDKGLPIVAIGMLSQKTPYALVALKSSGITDLKQAEGKRVSVWYTGAQFATRALLKAAGVDVSKVIEVPQAATMQPFVQGQVDIASATFFNELLTLYEMGLEGQLNIFDPADYGVVVPREVLIVNEQFMAQNPDAVQGFLSATLRGWKYALENPDEAIDILMKTHPGLDRAHEEAMLREFGELMRWGPGTTQGLGYIDRSVLEYTKQLLMEADQIGDVDLDAAYTLEFWERVPADWK